MLTCSCYRLMKIELVKDSLENLQILTKMKKSSSKLTNQRNFQGNSTCLTCLGEVMNQIQVSLKMLRNLRSKVQIITWKLIPLIKKETLLKEIF